MKYFFFWQGSKPVYISKCIERMQTILQNNLTILNEKNILNYIPNLPQHFFKIKRIALRVDYLRIAILYHQGGCYLDADTIIFNDFPQIMDDLPQGEIIGVGKNNIITSNAFLIAPSPKSNSLLIIKQKQEEIIKNKKGNLHWTDIGGNLIKNLSNQINSATFHKTPLTFLGWKNSHIFLSTNQELILKYLSQIIKNNHKGVVLYNQIMKNQIQNDYPPKSLLWYLINRQN